ncbi:MAG: GNAT family N-acetyltransferase [Candidatus Mycalebacterium zealandia]|nr:MAG: GNAT family N-acetyltransferase [Candidatus Mycalebacterium zealandia]
MTEKLLAVRKAKTEDAEAMAQILKDIGWSEKRNALPVGEIAEPVEELIRESLKNPKGHTVLVAENKNGKVAGFVNVHWVPFIMLAGTEGYVSDMFVSPSAAGMGAGSLLLSAVMKEGKKRDCFRLMVTNGKEKPSYKRGFYKKMGWTERPKVANFVYYYKEPWS